MVSNVVTGAYTETYDLNTAVGELSLLAIHTPQAYAVKRMFHGFFENYKKFRVVGCDFKIVCASRQELTPDLVGLEAGQVDPRDVLNPILFKACTGEGLNLLLDQIYDTQVNNNQNLSSINQSFDSRTEAIGAYYEMLADDSWRKAHPQSGMTVTGLRPMVHKVVTTRPFKWTTTDNGNGSGYEAGSVGPSAAGSSSGVLGFAAAKSPGNGNANGSIVGTAVTFVSNGITEMPWLDTAVVKAGSYVNTSGAVAQAQGQYIASYIPRVYMGCLILPPAILQPLYFRLQIRWILQFREFRPAFELGPLVPAEAVVDASTPYGMTPNVYGTYENVYHTPSSKEANPESPLKEYSSFETNESAQVEQIMEKVQ